MDLHERRHKLTEALKEAAINIERIRGALWLCDEMIRESEGNGIQAPGSIEREDGEPVESVQ